MFLCHFFAGFRHDLPSFSSISSPPLSLHSTHTPAPPPPPHPLVHTSLPTPPFPFTMPYLTLPLLPAHAFILLFPPTCHHLPPCQPSPFPFCNTMDAPCPTTCPSPPYLFQTFLGTAAYLQIQWLGQQEQNCMGILCGAVWTGFEEQVWDRTSLLGTQAKTF